MILRDVTPQQTRRNNHSINQTKILFFRKLLRLHNLRSVLLILLFFANLCDIGLSSLIATHVQVSPFLLQSVCLCFLSAISVAASVRIVETRKNKLGKLIAKVIYAIVLHGNLRVVEIEGTVGIFVWWNLMKRYHQRENFNSAKTIFCIQQIIEL